MSAIVSRSKHKIPKIIGFLFVHIDLYGFKIVQSDLTFPKAGKTNRPIGYLKPFLGYLGTNREKASTVINKIHRNLNDFVKSQMKPSPTTPNTTGTSGSQSEESFLRRPIALTSLMDSDIHQDDEDHLLGKNEWERYLERKLLSNERDIEPLCWWEQNHRSYPILYSLAMEHLQIPATSTPSERAFSQMGRLVTKGRNRLAPGTAGMLHFLKTNQDIW